MDVDMPDICHRIVHLDLKGAPPKLGYYEKLFPMLEKWGATGLLVEYEDMFPFTEELKDIAAPSHYSAQEILQLLSLAKKHNLEVIPLVQTFGHFEYVLKHNKFHYLRELPDFPMTLCPLHEDSIKVVSAMIDQVMALHPDIKWFHIGADEVFHLGLCEKCVTQLSTTGHTALQLFFAHIKQVLECVQQKYPNVQCIMWDDMYRECSLDVIKGSGICDLVEPMVWYYHHTFQLPSDLWERYCAVFPNIWVASAFKGATGPCMFAANIDFHLENHKGWLSVVQEVVKPKCKNFQGYCLTGWQRYDHYSVLCELLPAGIPSLALCLSSTSNGGFTQEVHESVSRDLGFENALIPTNPFACIGHVPQCSFPGSKVYTAAHILLSLQEDFNKFLVSDRLNGWMSEYHLKHNFTNPAHLQSVLPQAEQLLTVFRKLETDFREGLGDILYPDAIDEFLQCYVVPKTEKLEDIMKKTQKQLETGAGPKQFPTC